MVDKIYDNLPQSQVEKIKVRRSTAYNGTDSTGNLMKIKVKIFKNNLQKGMNLNFNVRRSTEDVEGTVQVLKREILKVLLISIKSWCSANCWSFKQR